MVTKTQLQDALGKASAAGDQKAVAKIEAMLAGMSDKMAKQDSLVEQTPWYEDAIRGNVSTLQNLGKGFERGVLDIGQGLKQGALHLTGSDKAKAYDEQIRREEELYQQGLGDSMAAGTGRIAGNILPSMIPGVGVVSKTAKGAAALGSLTGAASGLMQPVFTDGDYATSKAEQALTGAVLGGGMNVGLYGAGKVLEKAVNAPNAIVDKLANPGGQERGKVASAILGSKAAIRKGEALAEDTGISLSPAMKSSGKAITTLENLARQSILTGDKMFLGDMRRGRQMLNAINRTAKNLNGSKVSPERVANQFQEMTTRMTEDLAQRRSVFGRKAYGDIEKLAEGKAIIKLDNTAEEIKKIKNDFSQTVGADGEKISAQADRFMHKLSTHIKKDADTKKMVVKDPFLGKTEVTVPVDVTTENLITPLGAVKQLRVFSDAARGKGRFFEDISKSYDAEIARRLSEAMHKDLDNSANAAGGPIGDMLKKANAGWRQYSQNIDAIEGSALGKIIGKDFIGEGGIAFNGVPPEKVWARLDSLSPSELDIVKKYTLKKSPKLWSLYQRTNLERALDVAKTSPPSRGGRTLPLDSGQFVKALEGSTGDKAVNLQRRLKVIYGDSPQWPMIKKLMEVSRRQADATGRNFSGTAPAEEALNLVNSIASMGTKALGTAGHKLGINKIANVAAGNSLSAKYIKPPIYQLPDYAALARELTSRGTTAEILRQRQKEQNDENLMLP